MELTLGLALGAVPVLLLGASAALSHAYNKLRGQYVRIERDRASYLEVVEGSNDALFVINFVNGRIYQANDRAAAMLGYSREQLSRLSIFELHPPALLHRSAERIADAWESKGLVYDDIPLLTSKGELIAVECSTRVTSYRGDPAIILFARDIRERRALQDRVKQQQALVHQQNEDLLSSIRYAQRIQRAVLPDSGKLQELFPESFILFRPRDIVSGDLYWFAEKDGKLIVAAADCTGHGVPGALLSLIGASLFEEAVKERSITDPAEVLNAMREGIISALCKEEGGGQRDGMNIAIVVIDRAAMTLEHAGAFGPAFIVRDGSLIELKGDRMPVGFQEGEPQGFTKQRMPVQEGDRVYLFSDGIQDQFGGPQGKKLKSSGLKNWITSTSSLVIDDQYQAISDHFRMWKGDLDQVDDVVLIGLQV